MFLQLNNVSVLFAEDNSALRDLGQHVLKELGFGRVTVVSDGDRAFQEYKRLRHDIIISDWEMDGVSGPELLKKVRTSPQSPDNTVPFIMLTGYTAQKRVIQARDSGTTEFIAKPFTVEQITKCISYVINKPRAFVESPSFTGPDRRRIKKKEYAGPERRASHQWHIE